MVGEDSLSAKAESFSRLRGNLFSDLSHEELLENKSQAVTPYSNGDCNNMQDLNTGEIHPRPKGPGFLSSKDKITPAALAWAGDINSNTYKNVIS
jgi:hypothetical protein